MWKLASPIREGTHKEVSLQRDKTLLSLAKIFWHPSGSA